MCKECGSVIGKGSVIAKTAHTYKDGKCVVCGAVDPSYKPETTPTKDPVKTVPAKTSNVPKTGDNNHVVLWFVLLLVGAAGITAEVVVGRRTKRR